MKPYEAIMICQSAGVISVGHGILGRRGDGGGGSCGTMTRGDAGLGCCSGLIGEPKPAAVPCVAGVRGGVCAYAPRSCGGEPMALRGRPCGCGVPPGPSSDAPPMLPRRAGSNTQTQSSDAAAALARVSRGLSAAARFRRGRRYSLLICQKGLAAPPANPSRVAPKGQCRALRAPAAGARAPGTPGPRAPAQKARQVQRLTWSLLRSPWVSHRPWCTSALTRRAAQPQQAHTSARRDAQGRHQSRGAKEAHGTPRACLPRVNGK